ncbi:MAG: tRNA (adenosine(37)-N6)-threonylcarbamoyltransferase complex dimerization subunit type 1 TsaB [Eubacterium sp.]|nr:tRNA (adenosine(37)-N6)-threonylcarbamoyltransferase complex dimerization subunit type 1 TsaB [Eubacterium sp.]
MKIVALGSSGTVATVAVAEDDKIIAEYSMNYKKTHSETLLPMLDEITKNASIDLEDVDAVAVCAGPGSFTGLRIGAATAKGLALALDIPIVPVPTCAGIAYNMWGFDGLICPIVDARRGQVYTGVYRVVTDSPIELGVSDVTETTDNRVESMSDEAVDNQAVQGIGRLLECLMDQDAMDIHDLITKLNEMNERVVFLGDGVPVFRATIEAEMKAPALFAPAHLTDENAAAIATLAMQYMKEGKAIPADDFAPVYLRKSQAEREREKKLAEESQV